ncbi:MAG: ATP-binding cassette domain-containing protein [Deltaproteobacteria bacterium]|jgi:subfamily B ATP-binding cassette protein MsbA|nr:ATP-binding cassette domain-containing protein [Deltaproteobacteria bacterium]
MTNKEIYLRLLGYSRPYLWRIVLSLIFSLVVAGSDLAYINLIEPLVDKIIAAGNRDLVYLVPIVIIGLAITKGIGRFYQEYYIKTAGQLVVQDLRNGLFSQSMHLSMGFHVNEAPGRLTSVVLNDVGVLQSSAADVLVDGVRESVTLVGLVVLAFYKDWKLASVAFTVLPICVIPATQLGRRIRNNTKKSLKSMGFLTGTLQEAFSGIKVIKAFGREETQIKKFKVENKQFYRFLRKAIKYNSLTSPAVEILAALGGGGVVWYGVHRVLSGDMTQGQLFSIVAAIMMMFTPVKRLTRVSNIMQKSVGAAEGVFSLLDQPRDVVDKVDAIEMPRTRGEVVFDNVTFSYSDEPVLTGFNLHANPGEVIALVGPSGAGKSTAAGLMARFYDPQQGSITIDGYNLCDVSLDSLKKNLAFVDQETFLFSGSIRDNIRYGMLDADDQAVAEAARQAYADEFINKLPGGYDTTIGDRGIRLSGGQRQRLCVARALLKDAPILILDEATSALDTESEAMVQKALVNLMKNRTTLVIAHRLSTIMHADRIIVLDQGRVVETGTHQELLAQNGFYRNLYDMQFKDA